uniref:AlNc14C61G4459 protein n=1 Tax=Albugo laibachii Nc14 TaxID=890382 RepID=F0WCT3_9STRA|nr:AlNc14C61G4459 [Albugo laibachii Nc14]|eukprot:CCA19002.1 AlNc14C61G4459 [Albugo laibachii Nc14]
MEIEQDVLHKQEVSRVDELALELKKALFGLKQARRLWSETPHKKLTSFAFMQCLIDMCVNRKRLNETIIVVGVYVDYLLVKARKSLLVEKFFDAIKDLSVKDLGEVKRSWECVLLTPTIPDTILTKKCLSEKYRRRMVWKTYAVFVL